MSMQIDSARNDLLCMSERDFYIKYIVKTPNWYFSAYRNNNIGEMIAAIDHFRHIIADALSISFHSAHIVGSAKVGFSLSPTAKAFKPFHDKNEKENSSDIDIAIVSNKYFDMFWELLRVNRRVQEKLIYGRIARTIFRGYLNDKDIKEIKQLRNKWHDIISPVNKKLQGDLGIIHPISYRVYRYWEDLEEYQMESIQKLKLKMIGEGAK